MTKSRLSIYLALAAMVGAIASGATVFAFLTWMHAQFEVSTATAGIATNTAALESLRSGEQSKTVERLESALDGHLLSLGLFATAGNRNDVQRVLDKARAYRALYPRSTDNLELDRSVTATLEWKLQK